MCDGEEDRGLQKEQVDDGRLKCFIAQVLIKKGCFRQTNK